MCFLKFWNLNEIDRVMGHAKKCYNGCSKNTHQHEKSLAFGQYWTDFGFLKRIGKLYSSRIYYVNIINLNWVCHELFASEPFFYKSQFLSQNLVKTTNGPKHHGTLFWPSTNDFGDILYTLDDFFNQCDMFWMLLTILKMFDYFKEIRWMLHKSMFCLK